LAGGLQEHPAIRDQFPSLQVNEVTEKLEDLRVAVLRDAAKSEPAPFNGVPQTQEEKAGLLASRPGGWEYMLFAGVLLAERDRLEPKWRDEQLGLPGPDRLNLPEESDAIAYSQAQLRGVEIVISNVNRLFNPEAHERAFGALGTAGDAAQIEHLASRIMAMYEDLLDWAAGLRACAVPARFEPLYELLPQFAAQSIRAIRDFVDETAAQTARIPAYLEEPEPKEPFDITIKLVISVDEDVEEAIHAEIKRLTRET
jgi:hypothetical protein